MCKYYKLLPDKIYFHELVRQWKLLSFMLATYGLLYGAEYYKIESWDVGITLILSASTYLIAPWSAYVLVSAIRYRPKNWFFHAAAAIFMGIFVVGGLSFIYHELIGNKVLWNSYLFGSIPIFYIAGFVWLYRGSLSDFLLNIKSLISNDIDRR